tara:strand:- start:27907 stop:29361 length:1455 start_codon:yes stop_codon:yes gene_type:complete
MKNKIALSLSTILFSTAVFAGNFNVIIDKEKNSYVTPEWFTYYEYNDWVDEGYPYNCVEEFRYEGVEVYRKETCDQNQTRTYDEYLKEKYSGELKLISEGIVESRTITEVEESEVGSATITSDTGFSLTEGDIGENPTITLKINLNKALDFPVTYSYNTQDGTTSSVLDKAENLVYDEYGNPFISIVDNAGGGKLIFDGGFPKYYNGNWGSATTFDELNPQFKFMHNIIQWMSKTHQSRNKVLLYGDAIEGHNYSVTSTFNVSIPKAITMAGYIPEIKSAAHSDYNGSKKHNRKVDISLEELNEYASIIIMSSGGWESFTTETTNNFTTYVNNGGGVFIITDHDYFQKTGNQILRKFGSEFYGVINRNANHNAYKLSTIWSNLEGTEYDRNHELWNGFSSTDSIPAGGSEGNVRIFTPQKDIEAQSGTLIFNAGETEKEVTLTINGDNIKESNETFRFMLQSGNDTGHIDPDSMGKEITILDDD